MKNDNLKDTLRYLILPVVFGAFSLFAIWFSRSYLHSYPSLVIVCLSIALFIFSLALCITYTIPSYSKSKRVMIGMLVSCRYTDGSSDSHFGCTSIQPELDELRMLCVQTKLLPKHMRRTFMDSHFSPLYNILRTNKKAIEANKPPAGLNELLALSIEEIDRVIKETLEDRSATDIESAKSLYEAHKQIRITKD